MTSQFFCPIAVACRIAISMPITLEPIGYIVSPATIAAYDSWDKVRLVLLGDFLA
jgi:hypothetical protein